MKQPSAKMLLRDIKTANPDWFSRKNKRFFNDHQYFAYYGRTTGNRYLVRSTYAWTDMFGQAPRLHYRVNPIDDKFDIRPLVNEEFRDLADVKMWLRAN